MKITMSKMKNTLDKIESRLDNVEEKIRELKSFHRNYSKLITESEKSYWKKDEQSFKELCYNYAVLSRSVVSDSLWPHGHQASCLSPSPGACSNSCPLIESVMPSNHLFLCCPLLLLPSIFPSSRVFSNESVFRIRWPKYWSFSFNISPSNKYSGLISFRID